MVTLDDNQHHQISLKSRVILESLRERMLSKYPCTTKTPDSDRQVHKVQIRDHNGKMRCLGALINWGVTTRVMAPRLLKWVGISHQTAHITTLGLDGGVMQQAKDSRNKRITVKYLDYRTLVHKSDMVVVPMHVGCSTLLTIVSHKNFWHQLGLSSIDFPTIAEGESTRGNDTNEYGSVILGLRNTKWPAPGARSRYSDTRSNYIRRTFS